jgi:oligopeptide transport system substrate-binding protein
MNPTPLFLLLSLLLAGCNKQVSKVSSSETQSELRISSEEDPQSVDPRLVRSLDSVTPLHMLYEGLFRSQIDDLLTPSVAENVEISSDLKTYTFTLRNSYWSNGELVTANDFEETWKSLLDPSFPAPNAYQLYVIKGAKAYKEGQGPASEVAVHALDSKTLMIELVEPTPYFLALTSTHFFFPVHSSLRETQTSLENAPLISNGPFALKEWKRNNELTLLKNPHYWDRENVNLNQIKILILDDHPALQMFEGHELDWTGSPMSTLPQDAVHPLKEQGHLLIAPAAGTHWFRFNTLKGPFANPKLRKAFSLALDREAIVDHILQGNQTPAYTIVPPSFGLETPPLASQQETPQAWQLFQEVLQDSNVDMDHFPAIRLTYTHNDRNHKIAQAVQQQWKKAFNIPIQLEGIEGKIFYEKLNQGDYETCLGSWYADYKDPINFLELFKSKTTSTNSTGWENPKFTALLNRSALETDPEKRRKILTEAETLLLAEMPVAPLFHPTFNYVKNPHLRGVYFSELGYLDFKSAFWMSLADFESAVEE